MCLTRLFTEMQCLQLIDVSHCCRIYLKRCCVSERVSNLWYYGNKKSFSTSRTLLVQKHRAAKATLPKKRVSSAKHDYLFGVGPCYLALMSGRRTIFNIYIRDGAVNTNRKEFGEIKKKAEQLNIPILPATRKKLLDLSGGRPAQNIVMEASPLKFSRFDQLEDQNSCSNKVESIIKHELWLALDEVQDPMNFGAILRSSSLLGVTGVVVPKQNSAPLSPVVSKASAGAMETVNICEVPDMATFLQGRSSAGWDILGAVHPNFSRRSDLQPISCTDYRITKAVVIIVGNEGLGLQERVLHQCTHLISIFPSLTSPLSSLSSSSPPSLLSSSPPSSSQSLSLSSSSSSSSTSSSSSFLVSGPDSFNVSVATGILLFSIQRNKEKF